MSKENDDNNQEQNKQDNGTGAGVSGRPNSAQNHNPAKGTNPPNFQDGPIPGGADNTRGENVPRAEGHGGGAKRAMPDDGPKSPQGSHANDSTTRGADSSDKEFRNNQPNSSTLKAHKGDASLAEELKKNPNKED